ncbi:hypothetical protein BpHYR1_015380 [Brachionus plicatilis]|uniref:Uncharacterized protein n=1 Tax=Brachionus plicatilis TaxID=10195 RepID=A0A3M7PEN0_BRAPC|nr:hypothetical protein BpHYR1_015380 [Brachionus plicatilis]
MSDKLKSVKESHEYKEFVKLSELGLVLPIKTCGNENCKNFESEMEPDFKFKFKFNFWLTFFFGSPIILKN